jgi:hypothetical protein
VPRLLSAAQRFEVVGARDIVRQAGLDADNDVTIACDGGLGQRDVSSVDVVQLTAGSDDAGARDVDQAAANLRRAPGNRGDRIHIVRSARAGIDPAGHAVLQAHRRALLAAAGVGVDVDQAGGDDLAARIDRLRGVG